MDAELLRLVEERLAVSGDEDTQWAMLVLAACEGADSLDAVLGGRSKRRRKTAAAKQADGVEPPGAYLRSVTVEGFRGVGPRKTLELTPGPGLTLVIGRNGSGKSSFAEALEILLTGANWRWQFRSMIWAEGWRNLHHPSPVEVSAEFAVEGEKGATTIARTWTHGADLADSTLTASLPTRRASDLAALGWSSALESYRPFLSYNELGSMFDEGPTKLHDRLSKILGLGDLDYAGLLLREARLEREGWLNAPKRSLPSLLADLKLVDDERARLAVAALSGRRWSLETIHTMVADGDAQGASVDSVAILRALASLEPPSLAEANRLAARLRAAAERVAAVADSDARRISDLTAILRDAIEFHEQHGDDDCPVCGNPEVLDAAWRERALDRLADLDARNSEWEQIESETEDALREMGRFLVRTPSVLRTAEQAGIDVGTVPAAWARLLTVPSESDLAALADHLEDAAEALDTAAADVRLTAQGELDRRQNVWRPVALRLAAWLAQADEAEKAAQSVADLKAAEKWLRDASADVRRSASSRSPPRPYGTGSSCASRAASTSNGSRLKDRAPGGA